MTGGPIRHAVHTATAGALRALAAGAIATLLLWSGAQAATGNLRIVAPSDGSLTLTHSGGWSRTLAFASGENTLWDLPAGTYTVTAGGSAAASTAVTIWDGLTTRIDIDPTSKGATVQASPDDAVGAVLLLAPAITRALPGDLETLLAGLDTHVRWRPGAELGDLSLDIPTERREILAGQREVAGPIAISSSSLGPQAGAGLWQITPASPLSATGHSSLLAATVTGVTTEGVEVSAHGALPETRPLGVVTRGWISGRFSHLGDASPRSASDGVLPHNEADILDLVARAELGDATTRLLRAGSGQASTEGNRWGLACDLAARGWQRDHFLQEYLENKDHAPFEETALFKGRAGLTRRFGSDTSVELSLGYGRYLTWIGDGLYKKNLPDYGRPPVGGEADTLIYWPDGSDPLQPAHIFEYFGRKYTKTWTAGLDARRAVSDRTLLGLRGENSFHTYRRYEHFYPLDTWIADPQVAYGKTLAIGYDRMGEEAGDGDYDPGRARSGRAGVWLRHALSDRLRVDLELGAHWLACDDSALVSTAEPLLAGSSTEALDAEDLRPADAVIDPEARLAARWGGTGGGRLWVVGSRRMIDPPLEALFSPRAFLTDAANKEGVLGNPALEPEKELGVEVGGARPFTLAGRTWTGQAAAYAGWLSDAISMTGADLGPLPGTTSGQRLVVPTYVNGGALRRYGLHLDATTGDVSGRWWLRLAYDLGRIESDSYEPPLLDSRWLDPDHPQGEYESEGLASSRGGIYDGLNDDNGLDEGTYRASNYDRPHQLSLALILPQQEKPRYTDWFTAVTSGWTKSVVLRFESGQPFTQTGIYDAGVLAERVDGVLVLRDIPLADAERNGERMPARMTIDVGLTRTLMIRSRAVLFRIEALNLLGSKNAEAVYRATGEPDEDGYIDYYGLAGLPAGLTEEQYSARITDPNHYSRPFQLRAGVSLQLY